MKKENKKDYLRRILKVHPGDPRYVEMDTCLREYNKFNNTLNFNGFRGGEEEKVFLYLYEHQLTVASIVAKNKGKEKLLDELRTILSKAVNYYKDVLYPEYHEQAKNLSPKSYQIEMWDKERINSIVGPLANVDDFVDSLDKRWDEFTNYLYKTIDLVFSREYSGENRPGFLKKGCFEDKVNDEIDYYVRQVRQYSQSFEDPEQVYYIGKNDNPYKNLYLYCLRSYIKNFYIINIPRVEDGKFYDLVHFTGIEAKTVYGLSDIAEMYSKMANCEYNKAYGKIKQQFRKSKFMQQYKNDGKYEFPCPELPLATYVYYSKKNHKEPDFEKLFRNYDPLMVYVYAPLLRANMEGETSKLNSYNMFYDFILNEFSNALNRTDDAYITTFLEILLQCPVRLFYRCCGLDVDSVVG